MLLHIRFTKYGLAEDPTGAIVTWECHGTRLAEVTGTYRREYPPAVMLTLKHFNGEPCEDIAASAVQLVLPDSEVAR